MSDFPAYLAPTFAERRAARLAAANGPAEQPVKAEPKQVDGDEVEDRAVKSASTKKRPARKPAQA